MRTFSIVALAAALIVAVIIIAGCGGVGDRIICMEGSGVLLPDDVYIGGYYGDLVRFTPSHGAWIYVAMASVGPLGTADPYISVFRGDPRYGGYEIAHDDDSGFDYNAFLDFWAEEGVTYWVFFTSCCGDQFGEYEWVICEEDALVASVSAVIASPDAASDTPAKQ